MLDKPKGIEVYESRQFGKALDKLPEAQLKVVEDESVQAFNFPLILYRFCLPHPDTFHRKIKKG